MLDQTVAVYGNDVSGMANAYQDGRQNSNFWTFGSFCFFVLSLFSVLPLGRYTDGSKLHAPPTAARLPPLQDPLQSVSLLLLEKSYP